MRQYKMVQLSESLPIQGLHSLASVGMAFDYQQNDWSGRWKKLKNEMFFVFLSLLAMQLLKGYLIGWFVELGGFTLYVRLGSQRRLPYSVGTSFGFDQVLGCLTNGDIVAKNDNFTMQ
ncbi:hypothetical protein CQW23_03965 [Capsicum baccatum]|uniref:Uncharacterized protein n=1 Tax=Capsicum baccatum TaxID=33114 RepID=A0A2G2XDF8_CAPBA|nr:hypothetical protein CQW23_03965 [Capsicum baccatum]